MLEILQHCHSKHCSVKFSFEIPGQIFIKVADLQFESIYDTQCLPWDHINDEKVLDCIKFCTEKVNTKVQQNAIPVSALRLSVRTSNCLDACKINTVSELIDYTSEELLNLPNFGNTCLREIKEKLSKLGLTLALSS